MSSSKTFHNIAPEMESTNSNPPPPAASAIPESLPTRPAAPSSSSGHPGDQIFNLPKLRLQFADLSHTASSTFLASVSNPASMIQTACNNVLVHLYETPNSNHFTPPPTRSVTIILRSMGGVAYTTGMELDNDHKEIHFSLDYISKVDTGRVAHEIEGVITHELVHCLQYSNGCPGGLVEGIADWVRLQCDLAPPHWKRDLNGKWDRGYQNTAYFLQYLEERFGRGTVRKANERLRTKRYDECSFWDELVGWPIGRLWEDYCAEFKDKDGEL
ncbi:PBSP domain-containing protein [Zalerion maritima]|uniref:PBSP domain-containing protein n=1 Tax=Zalerion maritima TaxID=339359 RepID=A0AAD5RRW3_9PEZI|nr:PBSP domain-containing protein [Zalerion maritima]